MAHPASWQNQIPPDEAGIMRRLEDIERQMRELGPAIQSAVGPQIASLEAAVANISTLQGQMATQISGLAAAQATLTTAVGAISTLVNQQVATDAGYAAEYPGFGTSFATFAAFNFTVPSGYTQATIMAVASAWVSTAATTATTHALIGGVAGPDMYATGSAPRTMTAGFSRKITGLSAGNTIQVAAQVEVSSGSGSGAVITAATVTYLR